MLACIETVTLIHPVREDDGDSYECAVIQGASWYRKTAVALDENGAVPVPVCKVRIPAGNMPGTVAPKEGDYLVRGVMESVRRAPADFSAREYARVT